MASAWKELSFTGKVGVGIILPRELPVLDKSTSQSLQGGEGAWSRVNQSGGDMGPRDGPEETSSFRGNILGHHLGHPGKPWECLPVPSRVTWRTPKRSLSRNSPTQSQGVRGHPCPVDQSHLDFLEERDIISLLDPPHPHLQSLVVVINHGNGGNPCEYCCSRQMLKP